MSGDPICPLCRGQWPCHSERCARASAYFAEPARPVQARWEWRTAMVGVDTSPFGHGPHDPAIVLNGFEAEGWEVVKIMEIANRYPQLTVFMRRLVTP